MTSQVLAPTTLHTGRSPSGEDLDAAPNTIPASTTGSRFEPMGFDPNAATESFDEALQFLSAEMT
jgi:hypothetical protein